MCIFFYQQILLEDLLFCQVSDISNHPYLERRREREDEESSRRCVERLSAARPWHPRLEQFDH